MLDYNNISIQGVFIKSKTHEIMVQTILEKDEFASLFKDNLLARGTEIMNEGNKYVVDKLTIEMASINNLPKEVPSKPPYFCMKIYITKE